MIADVGTREVKHKKSAFAGLLEPMAAPETDALEEPTVPVEPAIAAPAEDLKPQAAEESKPAPKKARKPRTTTSTNEPDQATPASGGGAATGKSHTVNVGLPESLNRRYLAYKDESNSSHPEILFDAIEATYERLPELLAARFGRPKEGPRLFARPNQAVNTTNESVKTYLVRVSEENFSVLEDLWRELGAPNRNALIVTAYDAFLPELQS